MQKRALLFKGDGVKRNLRFPKHEFPTERIKIYKKK